MGEEGDEGDGIGEAAISSETHMITMYIGPRQSDLLGFAKHGSLGAYRGWDQTVLGGSLNSEAVLTDMSCAWMITGKRHLKSVCKSKK